MISVKEGAKLEGLRPEILVGLLIVDRVLEKYNYDTVITEGTGGEHMQGSLHYQGLALDIRSKHILFSDIKEKVLVESMLRLGDNFEFIFEDRGTPNEHWHIEMDPK